MTANLILDRKQTMQKIRRIAYEIYENNFQEEEIVLAGIYDKGYLFARLLHHELSSISPLQFCLLKITLYKFHKVKRNVSLYCTIAKLQNKCVFVADDVLNTVRTLVHSLKPFLEVEIKKIQTAVIVDRGHHLFPVAADYVGYTLSTTIQEHIEVVLEESESNRFGVYLS